MRAPFQESIVEAMDPDARIRQTLDAATRRLQLLELDKPNEEDYASRWRRKPGAKHHPLWKLIAQISFGIHLLHKEIAKSEEEVIRILQTHVDEIDGFLEDVGADFDLAMRDIDERLRLLLLPLEHGRTFSRMLRDRDFRQSIIEGNDIIERICSRTKLAMEKSLDDVEKGLEATSELAKFLEKLGADWAGRDEDMQAVYEAMRGNAQGWTCAFGDVLKKGEKLKKMIRRLERIVSEVERQAGIASRRKSVGEPHISCRLHATDCREMQRRKDSTIASPTEATPKESSPVIPSKPVSAAASPVPKSPMSPMSDSWRASLNKPLPPDPHRPHSSKRASHKQKNSGSRSQSHTSKPSTESRGHHGAQSVSSKIPVSEPTSPGFSAMPKDKSIDLHAIMQDSSSLGITIDTPAKATAETARQVPLPISPQGLVDGLQISLPVSPSNDSDTEQVPLAPYPAEPQELESDAAPLSQTPSVVSQIHRPQTPLEFSRGSLSPIEISPARISTATQIPLVRSNSRTTQISRGHSPAAASSKTFQIDIPPPPPPAQPDFNKAASPTSPAAFPSISQVASPVSPSDTDVRSPDSIRPHVTSPTETMLQEALPKASFPARHFPGEARQQSQNAAKQQSTSIVEAYKNAQLHPELQKSSHTRDPSSPPTLTHTGSTASADSDRNIPEVIIEVDDSSQDLGNATSSPSKEAPNSAAGVRARVAEFEGLPKQTSVNSKVTAGDIPRPKPGVPARVPVGRKASEQKVELLPTRQDPSLESVPLLSKNAEASFAPATPQQEQPMTTAELIATEFTKSEYPPLLAEPIIEDSLKADESRGPQSDDAYSHAEVQGPDEVPEQTHVNTMEVEKHEPPQSDIEVSSEQSQTPETHKRTTSGSPEQGTFFETGDDEGRERPDSRHEAPEEPQSSALSIPAHPQRKSSMKPPETFLNDDPPVLMIASFADIRRFSVSSTLDKPPSVTSSMSEARKSTVVERPTSRNPEAEQPGTMRRGIAATAFGSPHQGGIGNNDLPDIGVDAQDLRAGRNSKDTSITPPSPSSPLITEQRVVPSVSRAAPRSGGRSPGPYKLMPDIKSPPPVENDPMSPKTALPQWPKAEPQKRFRKPSVSMFKGMLSKKSPKQMGTGGLGGHVALV